MPVQTNAFTYWVEAFSFAGIPFIHILMKYVACSIGLMAAVLSAMPALPARASDAPRVLLSEINWAGSPRSTADEWFELANLDDVPVDVGGWVVNGVATSGQAISLAAGTIIPARGTLVIANYDVGENSTLSVTPDLITTAVSIPNRALNILIAMSDGTVVDQYIDSGTPDYGDSVTFASVERDLATNMWATASASTNLADDQPGSPGVALFPSPTPDLSPALVETATTTVTPTNDDVVTETDVPTIPTEEMLIEETPSAPVPEEPVTTEEVVTPEVIAIPEEETVEEIPAVEPVYVPVEEPTLEPIAIPEPEIVPTPEPEPTPAPTTLPEAADPVVVTLPAIAITGNVILSELVSDPDEGNEWVEIVNTDVEPIDLTGWYITDASGKATNVGEVTLSPGAFHVIESPLGKLNNDGDLVTLFTRNSVIVDTVTYTKDTAPHKGESLAWNGTTWATASPTPNAANAFPVPKAEEIVEVSYAPPSSDNTPAPILVENDAPLANAPALEAPARVSIVATAAPGKQDTQKVTTAKTASKRSSKSSAATSARTVTSLEHANEGERVQYTGTLIATPGTFGSQIAVLDGAVLYLHNADWPALALNDVVRVEGTVSVSRGEKRIKVTADSIVVTGQSLAEPLTYAAARTTSLVTVRGTVVSRTRDTITLDIDGHQLDVRATDATGISWSSMNTATYAITGVYRIIDGTPVLMPRSPEDVVAITETISAPTAVIPHATARPWMGAGLLTSSAGALGYWFLRSRSLLTA